MNAAYVRVVVAVVVHEGRVLISKRPQDKHLGGLWEFPGGKVEPGETDELALKREIKEEIDAQISVEEPIHKIFFDYPEKKVDLNFFLCRLASQTSVSAKEVDAVRWAHPQELDPAEFPPANRELLEMLPEIIQ